ncbi:sensor histidine kinase [Candidatus Nitronereus thalassa]|uniref:histidine kinase n=1 Tax=Candidatus Nitronereus thalassa TaxID=3020898 RepID=A0ABU3K9X9_9BACT|nr:ATP-binding protein [Candidatus Nitronereus thalassa]MDT7043177.1 ATP-binding protein [Candidatus Nitronereus thalassa]
MRKQERPKGLSSTLAYWFVFMMALGLGAMALLSWVSSTSLGWGVGLCVIVVTAFILAKWLSRRVLGPVWELQGVAGTLLKRWGFEPERRDDLGNLTNQLVQLTSMSKARIQELELECAKVGAVLDSMVEGVIALDRQGRVILMNPSARRILDLDEEPVAGQSLLEVIRNRGLSDLVEVCRTLKPNEQCSREVELQLPAHRILEVNAMPLPETKGIVIVFHDISEVRRLEQVRAEFVANVSHELRTPLTAIKGYLETLLDDTPVEPATHRRFLEIAHTQADRLSRLISDLSRLSDIETGKVVLHFRAVGLREFVQDLFAIFENEAGKRGIILNNEVPDTISVWADRDRLSQIFVNLIDNALKYTPEGGRVSFQACERRHGVAGLQIIDTGQGIPPSDISRITERFYRVDKARSRDQGGSGLGLAIVKHLVQLHGGSLRIESVMGKGTTVDIELPVKAFHPLSIKSCETV